MYRQPHRSMVVAEPVLRALGQALGPDREVVVVPGNHDAPLLRSWALAQGAQLQTSHPVPLTASPALELMASWLTPARVRVNYPGVWLGDRIWATHGHYLDHHLLPDSPFGLLRRAARDTHATSPMAYERLHRYGRRSRESWLARLLARPGATVIQSAIERLRVLPKVMLDTGLAPVTAKLLDVQMRRAATPAMARVVRPPRHRRRLGAVWPRPPPRPDRATSRGPMRTAPAARGSSTRAPGCTSRCSSTARPRHTPTGPAAPSCSKTASRPAAWGCSTT